MNIKRIIQQTLPTTSEAMHGLRAAFASDRYTILKPPRLQYKPSIIAHRPH